jgi:hypothetical protein
MITLKSLSRKLEKLETSMQKDARRLSKLIRKVKRAAASQTLPRPNKALIRGKAEHTAAPAPSGRQKRKLSAETRAKLSARMHERWAAKRAAVVPAVVAEPISVSTSNGGAGNGN